MALVLPANRPFGEKLGGQRGARQRVGHGWQIGRRENCFIDGWVGLVGRETFTVVFKQLIAGLVGVAVNGLDWNFDFFL